MRWNKRIMLAGGILTGVLAAGTATAAAADYVKARLYPVQVVVNQEVQHLPPDSVLNVDGSTYVPLRFFAEKLGATIGYQPGETDDRTRITVDLRTSGDTKTINPDNHLILDRQLFTQGRQGILNGIKVPLGASESKLMEVLGEPDDTGRVHTPYLKYQDTTFYLDPAGGTVNVMEVRLPFSPHQVKAILGNPDVEEESQSGYSGHILVYYTGAYTQIYRYSSKNAAEGTLLFKKADDPQQSGMAPSFRIPGYGLSVQLPAGWQGRYEVVERPGSEPGYPYYDFIDTDNKAYGGVIFTLHAWSKEDWEAEGAELTKIIRISKVAEDAERVYTAAAPGDVQFSVEDSILQAQYSAMHDDLTKGKIQFLLDAKTAP